MTARGWWPAVLMTALAACGGPVPPWTEAPAVSLDLRAVVAPTTVALLQPVTVELHLFRRSDLPVEFAPVVEAKDFLVETAVGPVRELGHGLWQTTTLVLRPVRGPGELTLPSFVAKAKDGTVAASTKEQVLVVTSALAGQGEALEAPGEPFPTPLRWWPWLAAAGGLVVLGLGVWWWRRRPTRPLPLATALPPHVTAQRALARLRGAPRTTPAQIEAFYVEVSAVLRSYVEARFGLHAPERTTEEFLRELEGGDVLVRDQRTELERFLSQCDLVKFAAVVPTDADHLATFALAEAFVERTRADRTEPAPPPPSPPARVEVGA
jgi:hypothetical protein